MNKAMILLLVGTRKTPFNLLHDYVMNPWSGFFKPSCDRMQAHGNFHYVNSHEIFRKLINLCLVCLVLAVYLI